MAEKLKNYFRDVCIGHVGQWLYRLKMKLTPQPIINEDGFQDLTPYNHLAEVDKDGFYCKTLKWAIDNQHTKNIALTGVYGSGKSSVLRKFEQGNVDYKILDISLADFASIFKNKTNPLLGACQGEREEISKHPPLKNDINLQELLERSIVQQMVYREPTSKLKYSRFKRIVNVKNRLLRWPLITLWLFSILLLFNQGIYRQTNILGSACDAFTGLLAVIFFIGSFIFVNFIMRNFSNLKLNRIRFSGAELEIGDGKYLSIFNKHLDEILYFFEVTNYDVVIIEDLDRFKQNEIFIKLRELNMLINNYKAIKRKVTFLYALGDDTFKDDKERTKFFDFIVPVIPVVTGSNSDAYILKEYADIIDDDSSFRQMVSDLALFIEDMRSIKNIFNEFKMYQQKIAKKRQSSQEKKSLFALIVYKNLLPEDFAKLNENKGFLHDIFHVKKQKLQNELIKKKQEEKREKENLIKAIKNEKMNSVEELRSRYIHEIGSYCTDYYDVNFNYDYRNLIVFLKDEQAFMDLITKDSLTVDSRQRRDISMKSIRGKLGNYEKRKKVIEDKVSMNVALLQKEIQEIETSLGRLKMQPLAELLKKDTEKIVFGGIPEKNGFISYLVRSGHIIENYNEFISYFYDGKITHADREYLHNVKEGKEPNYGYPLTKCDEIVKQLTLLECENLSVLNFDLLDYLFTCKGDERVKLKALISQLNEKTIDFIFSYLERSKTFEANFIQLLCREWDGFWTYLLRTDSINEEEYLSLILYYADMEDIKKFELKEYLEKKNSFLDLMSDADKYPKIQTVLDELGVEFEVLDEPRGENKLFEFIYENGNYVLNQTMIERIVGYYDKERLESLKNAHLTTIKASTCKGLYGVILGNLKEYILNVFLLIETNTQESKEVVLTLINHDKLELETKEKVISKEDFVFEILDEINNDAWHLLFRYSKIAPQWENVFHYFRLRKNSIDDDLLIYLNKRENYRVLANLAIVETEEFDGEFVEALDAEIVQCDKLSLESYESLMNSQKILWDEIDISMLSHDKLNVLIKKNKLTCSSENFENLKKLSNNLAIALIEQHYDDFSQRIDDFSLDKNNLTSLLSSKKITDKQKILLAELIDSEIIAQQGLAQEIIKLLLAERAKVEDAMILELIQYNDGKDKKDQNIHFLTQYMPKKHDLIRSALELLGKPYSDITIKGKNKSPVFPKTTINENFLEELKKYSYISSWRPNGSKIIITRKSI